MRAGHNAAIAAVALCALTAGCSNDVASQSAASMPGVPAVAHRATRKVPVSLRVFIPRKRHHSSAHFISPGTTYIEGEVYPAADPSAVVYSTTNVGNGSPACQTVTGGQVCTVSIDAPVGADDFIFTAMASSGGKAPPRGNHPSATYDLYLGQTPVTHATIVENKNNSISATVRGIVAGFSSGYGQNTVFAWPDAFPMVVQDLIVDASGNGITSTATDPFFYPAVATLTEHGGSGFAKIGLYQPAGSQSGLSVTMKWLDPLHDHFTVSFGGAAPPGYYATLVFSGQSFAGADNTQPVVPQTITFIPLIATASTTQLNAKGQTAQIAAGEHGVTGLRASSSNTAIATVTPSFTGSTGTFTVTAVAAGNAYVTVTDGLYSTQIMFTVTTTGGVIH